MQGVRFYLEYTDARKTASAGNVFAAFVDNATERGYEGLGAIFEYPNSPVASTTASREYLRTKTKRVPEFRARQIHPELFRRLENC